MEPSLRTGSSSSSIRLAEVEDFPDTWDGGLGADEDSGFRSPDSSGSALRWRVFRTPDSCVCFCLLEDEERSEEIHELTIRLLLITLHYVCH